MELFEKASRVQLRFATAKGSANIEDLWELPLTTLDTMARAVNKKIKEEGDESFLLTRSRSNTTLELQLDILKYVIKQRQEENEAKKQRTARLEELNLLKSLQADKKIEELKGLSSDEISKRIAELEG